MKNLSFVLAVLVFFVIGSSCSPDPKDKPDTVDFAENCDSVRLDWLNKMADFVPIIYFENSATSPDTLKGSFVVKYPTLTPDSVVYWGVKSDTATLLKVGVSVDTNDLVSKGYMNLQPLRAASTSTPNLYSQRVTWTIPTGPINTISVEVRKDGNPKGKGTLIADRDNSRVIDPEPLANLAADASGGI